MTIDERLERLTARHEALTQTVEHLAHQGEEQNARIDKLIGVIEGVARIIQNHERRLSDLGG